MAVANRTMNLGINFIVFMSLCCIGIPPKVVAHRLVPADSCRCRANFSRSAFSRAIRELILSSIWPWKDPDGSFFSVAYERNAAEYAIGGEAVRIGRGAPMLRSPAQVDRDERNMLN